VIYANRIPKMRMNFTNQSIPLEKHLTKLWIVVKKLILKILKYCTWINKYTNWYFLNIQYEW
jgi:hypothetical protein